MSTPLVGAIGGVIVLATFLGGLALVGILRWARQVEGRRLAIEAAAQAARVHDWPSHDRLVRAAAEALAAYCAIFRTRWNARDQHAFAELAAALEEVTDHAP